MNNNYQADQTNLISPKAKIADSVKIGRFCIIEDDVEIGHGTTIENYCIIKKGVKIGNDNQIKNHVELREGTIIGDGCYIDSRVVSSGNCVIGNKVTLRYDTIIARGVRIGSNTYISPRVMTNNLNTDKNSIGGAHIGENCFVGTNAVLQHGIKIQDGVTIGAMSFVNKDCESNKTYLGIPAKILSR